MTSAETGASASTNNIVPEQQATGTNNAEHRGPTIEENRDEGAGGSVNDTERNQQASNSGNEDEGR